MPKTGPSDSTPCAPRAKLDALADERRFHDLVMEALGDDPRRWGETATRPESHEWVYVVSAIKNYARRPWSCKDSVELTEAIRRQKRERETLEAAAKILETDLKRLPDTPAFIEPRRALIEAIGQLRLPRGAADSKGDAISQISLQGPTWQEWAYIVRVLSPTIYTILANHKITVATGPNSPIIRIMQDILQLIYGNTSLPNLKAISKLVQKTIDEA